MNQALGLVEVQGLSTAVVVADTMAKAANIQILEVENTKGSGYMTVKAVGDVGAVNASVQAGRQIALENQKLVSWKVIPRPSDYVEHTFCNPTPQEPKAEVKPVLTEDKCAQADTIEELAEDVQEEAPELLKPQEETLTTEEVQKKPSSAKGTTPKKSTGTSRKNKSGEDAQ